MSERVKRIEAAVGVNASRGSEAYGAGFPHFEESNKSLVKKHMTVEIYEQLKNRVTPMGNTLEKAIQSGIDNQDSGIGLYAGDEVQLRGQDVLITHARRTHTPCSALSLTL